MADNGEEEDKSKGSQEPTSTYLKAKRNAVLFSGALLLSVWIGLRPSGKDAPLSIMPFHMERPDLLSHVLAVTVLYFSLQTVLHWIDQTEIIRKRLVQRIDFFLSILIALSAIFSFVFVVVRLQDHFEIPNGLAIVIALSSTVLGAITTIYIARQARKSIIDREASRETKLLTLLTSGRWELHFNPAIPTAKKEIVFNPDGTIGAGQNKNEHSWRLREGFLELLNSDSKVFSRFSYDAQRKMFEHTNDRDTLSIRNQTISQTE